MLQSGTNGNVYSFIDSNQQVLAMKESIRSHSIDFIYNFRELDMMMKLKGNEHILELKEFRFVHPMIKTKSEDPIDSIFLIFDLADCDLFDMIDKVPDESLDNYYRQLIDGLSFIHSHNIIHRDIKPENILFFKNTNTLKYCDFGLSKRYTAGKNNTLTVSTPCYKAPELFFEETKYDYGIDIFSLGIVFCEMKFKRLYLQDTKTSFATLKQFIKKSKDDFTIAQLKDRFPLSRILGNRMQRRQLELVKRVNIFKEEDQHTELIQSMLRFIPEKRIKMNEIRSKLCMDENNQLNESICINDDILQGLTSEDEILIETIKLKLKSKEYFNDRIIPSCSNLFLRFYTDEMKEERIKVFLCCLYLSIKNENYLFEFIPRFRELIKDCGLQFQIDNSYFEELEKRIIIKIIDSNGLFHDV